MRSIRTQLIVTLLVCLTLFFAVASAALYLSARNALLDQFDDALATEVLSFTEMVEWEEEGGESVIDVEFSEFPLPEFEPAPAAGFYEVWSREGTPVARSPSLEGKDLPRLEGRRETPRIRDIPLPDGRSGRAATLLFSPYSETDSGERVRDESAALQLSMTIARSREELDRALMTLGTGFVLLGLLLTAALVFTVRWSVGRGLAPLDRIALEASGIDPADLSHRFSLDSVPRELEPVCRRFNGLLERLETAFLRERRFNANVAHELRTPLAELRILAEVSLKSKNDSSPVESSRAAFLDVLDIAGHMEKMITTLLAIVRSEAGRLTVRRAPVDLVALVADAAPAWQEKARTEKIFLELKHPDKAVVTSDRTLLSATLANLMSNALTYTPEGGAVLCAVEENSDGYSLVVNNTDASLSPDDLERMTEPFWQKDPSRTDTDRTGLGLSLAAAYAGILGVEIGLALPRAGRFEVRLGVLRPAC
jgi:signal transduction histidine kinase